MADTYRTGSTRGNGGGGSRGYSGQGAGWPEDPAYDGSRRSDVEWSDVDEDERHALESRVDDLIPVLGIVLGGAAGYMLATMVAGDGPRSDRGWRSARLRGRSGAYDRSGGAGMTRSRSSRSVEHDETAELIASNKVEGTPVYDRRGERIGEVHNFMVGKRSGRVAYAVMSFGGFLGIVQRYHALPWSVLTYDTDRGGYVIDADRDILMNAPTHAEGEEPFSNPDHLRRVREHWDAGRFAL